MNQITYLSQLFFALESGATLITVNNRLAREFNHRYGKTQEEKGNCVWETPQIMPWFSWLQSYYNQAALLEPTSILLNHLQEQSLWEQVIKESKYHQELLQVSATAKVAQSAWQLWHGWRLSINPLSYYDTEESKAFQEWSVLFKCYCEKNNWLDSAILPDKLINLLTADKIVLPKQMIFSGFDEYPPQQQAVFTALQNHGVTISEFNSKAEDNTVQTTRLLSTIDSIEELTLAASWAKKQLEDNPTKQVGIIIPELNTLRSEVVRIFDQVLHPKSTLFLWEKPSSDRAYNISLAPILTDYSLIQAALLILKLASDKRLPVAEMTKLLFSPFLAGAEQEYSNRALLDTQLRKNRETDINLDQVLELSHSRSPLLSKKLSSFKLAIEKQPFEQSPSQWVHTFIQWLRSFGWLEEQPLNSEEYQLLNSWHEALESFVSLELIYKSMSLKKSINVLRNLLSEKSFQPKTDRNVPIQILGVLEAVETHFDACWILGLHDKAWPQAPNPNPLIPIALQRDKKLPHSSARRELEFTRRIINRLLQIAPEVIVSYPQQHEDQVLRPSLLITHLPKTSKIDLNLDSPINYIDQAWLDRPNLIQYSDKNVPLIQSSIKGGANLLKSQALCPFQSFATYRLHAQPIENPCSGLSPMEQGNLIHRVLHIFWQDTRDHTTLIGYTEKELQNKVALAVREAIEQQKKTAQIFTEKFSYVEQERLMQLTLTWLEKDKARAPFRVVELEGEEKFHFNGLDFNIRVDRVDELENGLFAIVDYKTGESKVKHWFGDRPEEPQIPLYALAHKESIGALLFAQIRPNEMEYLGAIAEKEVISDFKEVKYFFELKEVRESSLETWEELLTYWQQNLETLTDKIKQGDSRVEPKNQDTCRYCFLSSFCRIKRK
ncbi:PD-(D/E)XK nuclease family protein [Candidatus Nitrosacidococcus sp. I8]|uniref:PD-(D/E)XK nuclease family protein n=1 Tax=Candidatus Nitrosacidococcus sp. I8 TaxID=2942908 RepID=UPI002226BB76|nr:PD-(D/E)XK nuclease family protein [Candidatus Nitrosacidococcus sp. I8]CAH9018558.1 ATP-dependent helicase/deoxyribonuclease subunit B [Candidatus Nitrosacidococcus sp. I8]